MKKTIIYAVVPQVPSHQGLKMSSKVNEILALKHVPTSYRLQYTFSVKNLVPLVRKEGIELKSNFYAIVFGFSKKGSLIKEPI